MDLCPYINMPKGTHQESSDCCSFSDFPRPSNHFHESQAEFSKVVNRPDIVSVFLEVGERKCLVFRKLMKPTEPLVSLCFQNTLCSHSQNNAYNWSRKSVQIIADN